MSNSRIDLYTEITCPWCLIGHHRLDKMLADRFPAPSVDIVHHPIFLTLDCQPEGVLIADLARTRHGASDPSLLLARPHAEARASGLDLDLRRQPFAYPTQAAQTLVRLTRERGTQHQLAGALSKAYFLEMRNIADPAALADIASLHGFDRAEVKMLVGDPVERERTEHQSAQAMARGIRSVPHFVFNGLIALNGGRSENELATAIERAAQRATEP